ncbi:MAG TPA: HipA domain-containing protein [Planktothrix sp.]|jgi:serine/threonine-protein kinase HipA
MPRSTDPQTLPLTKNVLKVRLNDVVVGTITRLADDRTIFIFDETYATNTRRPTLSLSYKAIDGGLLTAPEVRNGRLPPFFSNLLPEGHLRQYLANKLDVKTQREFFLLAALGDDLPGAVIIDRSPDLDFLVEDQDEADKDDAGDRLRFSLAGVQLKFSAILESSGSLTIPVHGLGGDWIVKVPNKSLRRVPEVEYSMLLLAKEAGIVVPEFRLVTADAVNNLPLDIASDHGSSLAVKRFDRLSNGTRVHVEDFAQVFGIYPQKKYGKKNYDQIAEVIFAEAGADDLSEFVKRLVFTVAIGNGDMHLKNWSLLYREPVRPSLSPAYDLIPTILYMEHDSLALKLGNEARFNHVTVDNFKQLAARARAPERSVLIAVREATEGVRDAWKKLRHDLELSDQDVREISKHMDTLPLFRSDRQR